MNGVHYLAADTVFLKSIPLYLYAEWSTHSRVRCLNNLIKLLIFSSLEKRRMQPALLPVRPRIFSAALVETAPWPVHVTRTCAHRMGSPSLLLLSWVYIYLPQTIVRDFQTAKLTNPLRTRSYFSTLNSIYNLKSSFKRVNKSVSVL